MLPQRQGAEVSASEFGSGRGLDGVLSYDRVPTILVSARGIVSEGLRSVLEGTRFRVVASVDRIDRIAAVAADVSLRFLVAVDGSLFSSFAAAEIELARLRCEYPGSTVAVLVDGCLTGHLAQSLACAHAVISFDATSEQIVNVLDVAMDGVALLPLSQPGEASRRTAVPAAPWTGAQADASRSSPTRPLSDRERAILRHLSAGNSNKSIARLLSITESTVKIHVKGVLRKVSASNRTQAAVWALTNLAPEDARSLLPRVAPRAVQRSGGDHDPQRAQSQLFSDIVEHGAHADKTGARKLKG